MTIRPTKPAPAGDRLHALQATATDGFSILVGPLDVGEGLILIDRHLAPNGWTPKFLPLTPVDRAIRHFTAARNPQPVEEADFYVALRRAIVCHEGNDGADGYRTQALLAHVEAHRPYRLWVADEHPPEVMVLAPGDWPARDVARLMRLRVKAASAAAIASRRAERGAR